MHRWSKRLIHAFPPDLRAKDMRDLPRRHFLVLSLSEERNPINWLTKVMVDSEVQELGKEKSGGGGVSSSNRSTRDAPLKRKDPCEHWMLLIPSTMAGDPRSGAANIDVAGSANVCRMYWNSWRLAYFWLHRTPYSTHAKIAHAKYRHPCKRN